MRIIDSHTGGEPTRVIVSGGPDLGDGPLTERVQRFRETADDVRRAVILEPRGFDAIVGALLCEPVDQSCAAGVIFFNNAGYLGMCGHGAIGLAVTLGYLGRIDQGVHFFETPVGKVQVELLDNNRAAIGNVASYRYRTKVNVSVPEIGQVTGDIAWGGNWFFLIQNSPVPVIANNIEQLTHAARLVRKSLAENSITGEDGAEIDHIEFFGPPTLETAQSKNFVLCPGGEYDRSPCGTGTSAKLACLVADGKLKPGDTWVQESIIGSQFSATCQLVNGGGPPNSILPTITGDAYVCGDGTLIRDARDPFANGICVSAKSANSGI